MITLSKLPYSYTALEPVIKSQTMHFHYDKHHKGYVDKLNDKLKNIPEAANFSLEQIILLAIEKKDQGLYNLATQVWNHSFFWNSLSPISAMSLSDKIKKCSDALVGMGAPFDDDQIKELKNQAITNFGSGWTWVVLELSSSPKKVNIKVVSTSNADNPMFSFNDTQQPTGIFPLFVIDVWEHSYYLDYQNLRADYVNNVIDKLMNYEFIIDNMMLASEGKHWNYEGKN